MSRMELEKAFAELVVAARRADLSARERDQLVWFLEREVRTILEPIADDEDAWAGLGFRRAAR